jgi:hypothetical protein
MYMLLPSKKYFLIVKKYIISHQILSILHGQKTSRFFTERFCATLHVKMYTWTFRLKFLGIQNVSKMYFKMMGAYASKSQTLLQVLIYFDLLAGRSLVLPALFGRS